MKPILHVYDAGISPAAMDLLARLRGLGSAVRVGGLDGRDDLPDPDVAVRIPWRYPLTAAPELGMLIDRIDPAAIVVWSPRLGQLAGAMGLPTAAVLPAAPRGKDARAVGQAVDNGAVMVALAPAVRENLIRRGVPADRVRLFEPPGADPVEDADRAAIRGELDLADDDFVLLTAPQAYAGRALQWPAWAMAIIRQITPRIRLVVAGEGPAVEHVRRFVRKTRFERESRFAGARAWEALAPAADAICLCEPDGYCAAAAATAIRCRRPIIAADAGDAATMLTHGETALLHRPEDPRLISKAIWTLMEEPDTAAALAQTAFDRLGERFEPGAAAQRWRELLPALPAARDLPSPSYIP